MTDLKAGKLFFEYKRHQPIIDDFSFEILAGDSVALTGTSGTGKSTLLYVLAGLLTPVSGQLLFNGKDVSQMSDPERTGLRNSSYGFVFQDYMLDPKRTALHNVMEPLIYQKRQDLGSINRAMSLMHLMGVDQLCNRRPADMSGGQAQRVAVCRALITNPEIVFADEPTGNLDDESAEAVMNGLLRVCEGGGCLIVATHDASVKSKLSRRVNLS